jgi:S-adenosylmethionine-dependent methyltransferase
MSRFQAQAKPDPLDAVRESLLRNYFTDPVYLATAMGQSDFANHLERRLATNRERIVPWITSFHALDGARLLEIGCGTGASTLALAERDARVTAVDLRADSIRVAEDRCRAYGKTATFLAANCADIQQHFAGEQFDIVIFYAALEHMTHEERRTGMRGTWEMLARGGSWVVIDTPNRLWYFDGHTALLPFYHWLPDRLAFEYARFSPREYFREVYSEFTPDKELHFLRRGRGVSFHEFDLFIAPTTELNVISCLHTYVRTHDATKRQNWVDSGSADFAAHLRKACPKVHSAFFEPSLDLAIRK